MFNFVYGIRDSNDSDDDMFFGDEYFSCVESDDEEGFDGYDTESDVESHFDDSDNNEMWNESDGDGFNSNDGDDNFQFIFNNTLSKQLILWAIKFWISHEALSALLLILRNFGHKELPKLARTLLHTPRKAVKTRPCSPGEFFYRGIQYGVFQYNNEFLTANDTLDMDFFIDGLSLSDSSKIKMWPIMGSFVGQPKIRPLVAGCYAGKGDPSDPDDFMKEFVEELKQLIANGILVTKKKILKKFNFRIFVADSPARALGTGTMSHASYYGCPKCDQVCCSKGHKLYYQFFVGELRTDESFRQRVDPNHHRPEYRNRSLSLESVMGMISQFVIDAMHAIDLGVTKKIVKAILNNGACSKVTKTIFASLESRFKSFRAYVPSEFARKPRTLHEIGSFKAAECRQMLLYTLPVLLKNLVSAQLYNQVVKLHVAIRLLSDPLRYKENVPAARKLIEEFVYDYDATFGADNFTFNTHILLHIPDYVEMYGPLYSFSAYKYENHMRLIKRLLRRKNGHVQQFFNRIEEMRFADELENEEKRHESRFDDFIVDPNSLRDSCCMVQPGVPIIITNSFTQNGVKMIRGNRFLQFSDFYDDPVPSMDNTADSILNKFFRMPYEDKYVLVPILHIG